LWVLAIKRIGLEIWDFFPFTMGAVLCSVGGLLIGLTLTSVPGQYMKKKLLCQADFPAPLTNLLNSEGSSRRYMQQCFT